MSSILLQNLKIQKLQRIGALKRGTLLDFLTSIIGKLQNIEREEPLETIFFPKKVSQCQKKLNKRGTFGSFKIEGDPLRIFFEKKSQSRRKLKRGLFSLARFCMLRGKTGKTFLVQFARRNGSI